ncbi:MAG: beta-ketoacyl-ACP synthase II [Desulfobacterales bacterium]|nr:beta-ketoacyl-ACP synthase II [Desulfobacterales bacterium]
MQRRVVITGMGLITPLGIGVKESWTSLCLGKSGICKITKFDTDGLKTKIAGEVKNFKIENFISNKTAKKMLPFVAYALACSKMAIEDAHIHIDNSNCEKIGVILGCTMGGIGAIEETALTLNQNGSRQISPFFIPSVLGNMVAAIVSINFGTKGLNYTIDTACASGAHAVGESFEMIRRGRSEMMITGGVDSTITPLCIAGFNAMKALSVRNDEPEKASRPFDRDRDGFVVGEGGGILVLESLDSAIKRGANIYAEICGYGANSDAYHITAPAPEGEGSAKCMQLALFDAGISHLQIDYINAHGTSTKLNDISETIAIKKVFQDKAKSIAVSSIKSMIGHLIGAAGSVATAVTALVIHEGIIPPTINLDIPDTECDLDYVPHVARKTKVDFALINSFGFGGTNASLVLKKV